MDISRAKDILDYWFSKGLYTPDYDKWFMNSQNYDAEIKEKFGDLLKEAEKGNGIGWLHNKDSFVAYIILMITNFHVTYTEEQKKHLKMTMVL